MYIIVTCFQWLLGFKTPVPALVQQMLYIPSHLSSPGMCTLMGTREYYVSTSVPKSSVGLWDQVLPQTKHIWGSDFQPRFSFIYTSAPCHAVLRRLPFPSLPCSSGFLILPCSLHQRTKMALSSVLSPNSSHRLWLQRSARLRFKLPWKHLNGDRWWMKRTRMAAWWPSAPGLLRSCLSVCFVPF